MCIYIYVYVYIYIYIYHKTKHKTYAINYIMIINFKHLNN